MAMCQHCKNEPQQSDLLINSRSTNDTTHYWCRSCNTERCKKYRGTQTGKNRIFSAVKKSISNHRAKQLARHTLNNAIVAGKIKRATACLVCGKNSLIEGHHDDYSKPLNVQWLCRQCHSNTHKI